MRNSKTEKKYELPNDYSTDEENAMIPENVELPRKGNDFRVMLERKLGVDWEHTPEDGNSELCQSLQTNMLLDGYAEANKTLSCGTESHLNTRELLQDEYRALARKYSYNTELVGEEVQESFYD